MSAILKSKMVAKMADKKRLTDFLNLRYNIESRMSTNMSNLTKRNQQRYKMSLSYLSGLVVH